MKVGEIIQRIQSLYSKGVESDDTRLSARHIFSKMETVRKRMIEELLFKKINIGRKYYKSIVVDLEDLEDDDIIYGELCPTLMRDELCNFKKISCTIPLYSIGRKYFIKAYTVDFSKLLGLVDIGYIRYIKKRKYTSRNTYIFLYNDMIYVYNPKMLKEIFLRYVPDVFIFKDKNSCEKIRCMNIYDMEYPIPDSHIDILIQEVFKEFQIFFKIQSDLSQDTNEEKDNPTEATK